MIERHSPIAHSAYHDLLSSLRDEAVAEIRGTPTRIERNGRIYWYDTYRVGSNVKKTYIGEDNDATASGVIGQGPSGSRRARSGR